MLNMPDCTVIFMSRAMCDCEHFFCVPHDNRYGGILDSQQIDDCVLLKASVSADSKVVGAIKSEVFLAVPSPWTVDPQKDNQYKSCKMPYRECRLTRLRRR